MKMVKKILLGLALAGTVLALAGCSMGDDKQMDKEGDKWDFTATIDNTKNTTDKMYSRAWTQLGKKESVSKIKTTLTIYTDNIQSVIEPANNTAAKKVAKDKYKLDIESNPKITDGNDLKYEYWTVNPNSESKEKRETNAVVGFLFDLHKTTVDNKTVYDFVLLGIQASTGRYYVERYTNVPEKAMSDPTSLSSLWSGVNASTCTFLDGKNDNKYSSTSYYASTKLNLVEKTDEDGKKYKTLDVEVTQDTKGTYVLKFGGVTIPYTRTTPANEDDKKDGTLRGGAGVYANAPLGTIAYIHSKVDKDNTEGLYEEVEE